MNLNEKKKRSFKITVKTTISSLTKGKAYDDLIITTGHIFSNVKIYIMRIHLNMPWCYYIFKPSLTTTKQHKTKQKTNKKENTHTHTPTHPPTHTNKKQQQQRQKRKQNLNTHTHKKKTQNKTKTKEKKIMKLCSVCIILCT